MKLKTAFAVMVLLFAPAAASSTSKAALIGGSALSTKAAIVDISAVSKVHKRRHYRQRHYRRRYTSRRVWRPRYWTYQPHYSAPLLYDFPERSLDESLRLSILRPLRFSLQPLVSRRPVSWIRMVSGLVEPVVMAGDEQTHSAATTAAGAVTKMGCAGSERTFDVRRRSASMWASARSDKAVIVNSGLTPSERGMIEPSITYRPSCTAFEPRPGEVSKTSDLWLTTPSVASRPIAHPPSG